MAPASHAFPQSATNHPSPPRSLGAWQSGFGRDNGDFGRLGSNGGRDADWAISLTEGQNQILEKIVEGEPLSIILDALAIMIEAHSDKALYCSFLLFDAAENCLRHGAAPSLPKAYCEQLDGVVIGPNVGSCGTAAYLTASVTVEDISVDPLWDDFSEMALTFGLRSCWSTPVLGKDGKLLATMGIYHPFPHCPDP
ncbi:MAG: GAF domain-containing protein [Cyanophyceae cyanobacterium]